MNGRKETAPQWDKENIGKKNHVKVVAYSNPKMPSFN